MLNFRIALSLRGHLLHGCSTWLVLQDGPGTRRIPRGSRNVLWIWIKHTCIDIPLNIPRKSKTETFFPTCQVRVVRFYVSCLVLLLLLPPPASSCLLLPPPASSSSCSTATLGDSVLCRTSTTTIHAQCSLPDLNHDHPRPVFPAGPQPRPSTPSVPCRTSTASIHAKCSLPDLM